MKLIHSQSLASTIHAIDDALFFRVKIPSRDATSAAKWLSQRQGLPGSYAGMFAPTSRDREGIRLFTGERITTHAGTAHVLGEETCRVLRCLGVRDASARRALEAADAGMLERLHEQSGAARGDYCCGTCSVALWRNLASGGLDAVEARLADGMRRLEEHAQPDGTWRRYPFYYTLLALIDIDDALAQPALRHAAPRCERLLRRAGGREVTVRRRRALLERVLERVGA